MIEPPRQGNSGQVQTKPILTYLFSDLIFSGGEINESQEHLGGKSNDDVQTLSDAVTDLIKFDQVMQKCECTSGAIFSRNKKSKVMGLGLWKGKEAGQNKYNG